MRVLIVGWPSFRHGEATAGDVLAMSSVADRLGAAGIDCEQAFSPVFRPGVRSLDQADPERYTHLVFACGPAHGFQLAWLHERYARCHRIAVGVSVIDPDDPGAAGFHRILARDGTSAAPDLCWSAGPAGPVPVVGVALAPGQAEYGARGRHGAVHDLLGEWLRDLDAARVPVDTRLDTTDWRHCATPDQFAALVSRLDVLAGTRLHGLVFGLRAGVPVLAVDPVHGGGKVTAQARSVGWPAVLPADELSRPALDRWWAWCLSAEGRALAGGYRTGGDRTAGDGAGRDGLSGPLLAGLLRELRAGAAA